MNQHAHSEKDRTVSLVKRDPHSPAFRVMGRDDLVIKDGVVFAGRAFTGDVAVAAPEGGYAPGTDYVVKVADGEPIAAVATSAADCAGDDALGGFHFAPGGNAAAREGGDDVPAINPHSLWDRNFRPASADPRGMARVLAPSGPFWCDIYLTGVDHLKDGTSRHGATIADGDDRPLDAAGKKTKRFDYGTARGALATHGKGLLSVEEFFAAAFGVTECSAPDDDPEITGLDAPRTSRFGLMQATGNLWIWGHDGDPDTPRAAILGGSWLVGDNAGSRCANVDVWPGGSVEDLGARGRSDHLQPE